MSLFRQISGGIRKIESIEIHKGPLGIILVGKGIRQVPTELASVTSVIIEETGVRSRISIGLGKMIIECKPGGGYDSLNVVETELEDGIITAMIRGSIGGVF